MEEKNFIYHQFDHNGKGLISLEDLGETFARMSFKMNRDQLQTIFKQFKFLDPINYTIDKKNFYSYLENGFI